MRSHKRAVSCLLMRSTWPENQVYYGSRRASAHQKGLKSAHLLHGIDYFLFCMYLGCTSKSADTVHSQNFSFLRACREDADDTDPYRQRERPRLSG
jgi:hypothetical protein